MMIAMMFPAVAPIVLMHRLITRRRGEGLAPTFAFGASYQKTWRHGVGLTQLIGIATVLFAIAVLIHPSLLATVAPFKASPPMPMNG